MSYSYSSDAFTARLRRSLENPLRLLHRSNSHFFILGATGNVYTVSLTTTPTCSCPDSVIPCKHILYVYVRVLSLPLDDPCLRQKTLTSCKVTSLLAAPSASVTLAGEAARKRFHEMYESRNSKLGVSGKDGSTCPVCMDELGGRRVVACATCKNPIHEECWMTWKRRGSRTCVMCRATWREMGVEDEYINLSAYVSDDDNDEDDMGYVSQNQNN